MKIENLDGSGWTINLSIDDDKHLTVCASHSDNSGLIDITDDVFDWDNEFGMRLSTQNIEDKYKELSEVKR